ncbi:putative metal-dependent enzyme (double-stranded beta helix superfamily) [Thermocatellispora tengchongensis]|uniref:Putative metal-dependent enzyme (Double-stranded beta helix superfamily) n=1 Tax=Thermocatellispora tengchongensis TaxID=1073253 RepID=A0A840P7B8_9ACTN|nr:cysteine dioxygenase family protein [Thermocatellispora tengchongensis]MBB5134899.1 putative metal-dependent enzyme (double-stranded beta helix superfamily) [Thermocatellispora tengchongensis]
MNQTTTIARPGLAPLVTGIRALAGLGTPPADTARAVAGHLRANLPGPDILSEEERLGSPDGYVVHVLHTEESFSIAAVVWRPGQETAIHDHVAWCVFGVLSGIEYETLYRLAPDGTHLTEIGRVANRPGEVSGFAPPGDIHSVRNTSGETGVSLHVYGADLARLGSSVRRAYTLPVR